MWTVFNAEQGSELRALIRLVVVGFTAFGLKLHVDQIALIQATLETTLQLFVKSPLGSSTASPDPVVTSEGLTPSTVAASTVAATVHPIQPQPQLQDPAPVDNGIGYMAPISGDV